MNRPSHVTRSSGLWLASLFVGCGAIAACSGSNSGNGFGDDLSGANGQGGDGGLTADGGPGGQFGNGNEGTPNPDAACAAEVSKGEQSPLDIYMMIDQSGSMNDTSSPTKWDSVTEALKTFVKQPSLNGVSVGLQFFGVAPGGGTKCPVTCTQTSECNGGFCFFGSCVACGGAGDSCDAADYAKPDVEIAALPGVANALVASIDAHGPSTNTPTSAALQGTVDHAKAWAVAHPGHVVIGLFATDGEPSECDVDMNNINKIASDGANGTPKVLTFVIGVGSSLAKLNGIAKAGGTNSAFIVDTSANVNQQFLDALNKIRGAALGCQYNIPLPKSGTPDYGNVNVQYTPEGSSAPVTVPKVADKGQCPASGDAWYYDSVGKPTQILLCESTCKMLASKKASVNVLTGCSSIVK